MFRKDKTILIGLILIALGTFASCGGQSALSAPPGTAVPVRDLSALPRRFDTLNRIGVDRYREGDYHTALTVLSEAGRLHAENRLPEDPRFAQHLHNLGTVLFYLKQYERAEPAFQRALALRRDQLGIVHKETLQTASNLAVLALFAKHYAEAEGILLDLLEKARERLGGSHPFTARILHDLGEVYRKMDLLPLARYYHHQALSIRLRVLAEDHVDVAASYHNMGEIYRTEDRLEIARPLYARAVAIYRKHLNPTHPFLVTALNNYEATTSEHENTTPN